MRASSNRAANSGDGTGRAAKADGERGSKRATRAKRERMTGLFFMVDGGQHGNGEAEAVGWASGWICFGTDTAAMTCGLDLSLYTMQ